MGPDETHVVGVGSRAARGTIEDKELLRTSIGRRNQLYGYVWLVGATEMNDQQCLPAAAERTDGSGGGSGCHSPSRAAGASRRVRQSPSTPLIGGYGGRRWWSLSSSNVWCSANDQSDFEHISIGTLVVHTAKPTSSRVLSFYSDIFSPLGKLFRKGYIFWVETTQTWDIFWLVLTQSADLFSTSSN